MTSRRETLKALGAAALAQPFAGLAQQTQKVRRIGCLSTGALESELSQTTRRLFAEYLRRVGYEEGRNLSIEWRYAEGQDGRLAGLAEELVRLDVELIVAFRNLAITAAKRATQTIPIVMANSNLPVENRLVESLARPGGNVTGTVWSLASGMTVKQVQLLKDAVPRTKRLAMLWDPVTGAANGWGEERLRGQDRDLASIDVTVTRVVMTRSEDLKTVLDRIATSQIDALWVASDPVIVTHFGAIAAFAIRRKLVSVSEHPAYAPQGGLFYYGPDYAAMIDKAASYVERILRGAKPGNLAIEQPTKFELVLNMKTAKAMGITLPPSFLLRVTRIIE